MDEDFCTTTESNARKTWAEKLGYPLDRAVLIIHADDIGANDQTSDAAILGLTTTHYQSVSVIIPGSGAKRFADWARLHSHYDIGIHLTLTSERPDERWSPVAPLELVSSLVDDTGNFPRTVSEFLARARPQEVEIELRAQYERALELGIRPTHLDCHMGAVYSAGRHAIALFKVAAELDLPVMMVSSDSLPSFVSIPAEVFEAAEKFSLLCIDELHIPRPETNFESLCTKLVSYLESLRPPRIVQIIVHPEAGQAPGRWGMHRLWENDLIQDPRVRELLESDRFLYTDWRELSGRWKNTNGRI